MMHLRTSYVVSLALLLSSPSWADETPTPGAPAAQSDPESEPPSELDSAKVQSLDTPAHQADGSGQPQWQEGVSKKDQDLARTLFQAGNEMVRESFFVAATNKYDLALKSWDHPSIHYNLALALLNLDQPLRLRAHLLAALKYEGEALGADKKLRAEQYLKLVEKQLSHLEIYCEHKGAKVELDGEPVFTAPGKYADFLKPGQHTVRTTASGFEASERSMALLPGQSERVDLKLYTGEDWTQYKRRWKPWGPIIVTVSGVVTAGVGGLLFWQGGKKTKRSNDEFDDEFPDGGGEDSTPSKTGQHMETAGIITMGVGAAAALTGGVLLFLNRKIPYRVDPTDSDARSSQDKLSFTPLFSPRFSGLITQGTF